MNYSMVEYAMMAWYDAVGDDDRVWDGIVMVWYGMVWHSIVLYGMVQDGIVR